MTWLERISNERAHWRVKNFFVRWKKKGWNLRQARDAWHCVERDVKRWVPEDRAEALLKEGRSKLHLPYEAFNVFDSGRLGEVRFDQSIGEG